MNVYDDDGEFTPEYKAYLDTLKYDVTADARVRKTYDASGALVRFEVWDGRHNYYDFPMKGWMNP